MAVATDEFKRRVATQQQQVRDRVAATTAQRTMRAAPGLSVGTATAEEFETARQKLRNTPPALGSNIEVGTASQAEFDAAVKRAASSRGPQLQVKPTRASTLLPEEVDSLNRQSQGRFGQAHPQARGTTATRTAGAPPLPPSTPASQVRFDSPRATLGEGLANAEPRTPAGPSRAAAVGQAAGQRVGQVLRHPGVTQAGRVAGRVAAPLGAVAEGLDVARVAGDANSSNLDVASQAARGVSRMAGGTAGAIAGAKLGAGAGTLIAPGVGTAVGGVVGGIAGGLLGSEGVDRITDFFAGDDPADGVRERETAAVANRPDFSNVVGGSRTVQGQRSPEQLQRQAANDGITPVGDRTGAADEVLGTFQGRAITRAESDRLGGQTSFGGTSAPKLGDDLVGPPRGANVQAGNIGGGADARAREITDPNTAAGKLYATLAADKTPTGKRMAAQFLETYVGSGTAERGQDAGLRADEMGANATLLRGREGDASAERQVVAGNRSRPQYVFNDDGSIGQLSDGLLTPVTAADGSPAKASPKGKGSPVGALKEQEELLQLRIGKSEDYATPDEYQAARAQALQQLMAELGVSLDAA
jgi:hypothetical protein